MSGNNEAVPPYAVSSTDVVGVSCGTCRCDARRRLRKKVSPTPVAAVSYAKSGTHIRFARQGGNQYLHSARVRSLPMVSPGLFPIPLCPPYAMSSTDFATPLCPPHAISSTDFTIALPTPCPVLTERMVLRQDPACVLDEEKAQAGPLCSYAYLSSFPSIATTRICLAVLVLLLRYCVCAYLFHRCLRTAPTRIHIAVSVLHLRVSAQLSWYRRGVCAYRYACAGTELAVYCYQQWRVSWRMALATPIPS
eukprot:1378888-Rhodomonas_salina.2